MVFPLIPINYKKSVWKTILLSSFAYSVLLVFIITISNYLSQKHILDDGTVVRTEIVWKNVFFTFLITFVASLITYATMNFAFGFQYI